MVKEFKLEKFIGQKKIYSKLGSALLSHMWDLEAPAEVIESGFVTINTPEALSKRRASYLKRLGVNVTQTGRAGEQILTFYQTSVADIVRLARRPWVQRIEMSQQLGYVDMV